MWGPYDFDYARNLIIQIFSFPARAVLVDVSVYLLLPHFLFMDEYLKFLLSYSCLVLAVSIFIQRPIIFFFIQPNYLPDFGEESFFSISVLMNTMLDVNIAAVIPLGYALVRKRQNHHIEKGVGVTTENKEYIFFKVDKSNVRVRIENIVFIESQKNYIRVNTKEEEILTYRSLSSVLEDLPEHVFLQVHRSYIVNKLHIRKLSSTRLTLINDVSIPVGRKHKEKVKSMISSI